MNILIEGLVLILTAYLSFTTTLATSIENVIERFTPSEEIESVEEDNNGLASLPSRFRSIPDILLRSAEYQQAALGASAGLTESTTDDPTQALVNIFCTFTTREFIRTTTGTGFFIDADGVIITNAHVAQFLLMEGTTTEGTTDCTIRTGSPATARYRAELLYLPPAWVQDNASQMKTEVPMGTGERDYALMYVSETIDGSPLPAQFPALEVNSDLVPVTIKSSQVIAAGYPAGNLVTGGASTALYSVQADTSITDLYTFGSNYADVLALRGSVVGAEGASGGPVLNSDGEVIGMISTRGDDAVDGAGSLRAITMSHINRTIEEETGFTLAQNLNGDLSERSAIFARTLTPFLLTLLEQAS
jgi:S1-C subfamily serine protease